MTVNNTKSHNAMGQSPNKYCYDYPRPSVTVDTALFRLQSGKFEILLIQRGNEPFKGRWALPGGFVDEHESLRKAALRELKEETGIGRLELMEVGAFGDPGRDPRGHTVSIAFGAVVPGNKRFRAGDDADDVAWHDLTQLPELAFDHLKIIRAAAYRIFNEAMIDFIWPLKSKTR